MNKKLINVIVFLLFCPLILVIYYGLIILLPLIFVDIKRGDFELLYQLFPILGLILGMVSFEKLYTLNQLKVKTNTDFLWVGLVIGVVSHIYLVYSIKFDSSLYLWMIYFPLAGLTIFIFNIYKLKFWTK
jgi:hypothetical protein